MSMQSGNLAPQDNSYLAIGGPLPGGVDPETRGKQGGAVGSVVYEGLKTVVKGLYDCSDMFLPLKTVAGGILTFIGLVESVSENKKELEDLKAKLEAILSIVEKYKRHGGLGVINHRIENFCQAITLQFEAVEKLQKQSRSTRAALAKKDADTILKALRNINSLCDAFQIDTQLNIEVMVGKILEHLDLAHNTIGFIDKRNHEMTSYKTRGVGLISMVTRSQDLLDVFAVGSDGRVYTAAWQPGDSAFRGWWKILGRTDLEVPPGSTVAAVSRSADKLDVFVTGIDGRVYTAAWEPSDRGKGWRGWWPVANIKAQPGSPVSAVSRSANKLDIFVAGADGKVWTAAWEPRDGGNGFRGGWLVGDLTVPPAAPISVVSRSQDKLDVFATGIDGKVYTAAWEPSHGPAGLRGWRGWWHVAGGFAAPGAPVGVVSRSANKLDVFVTGLNNRIWTAAWQPSDSGKGFRGWWQVGDLVVPPRTWISAVSRSTDKMDVFATGADGRVYTAAWETGDIRFRGWAWVASGQSRPGAPVGAVSRSTDKLDATVTGLDGRVWTAAWEPFDRGWSFRGWWGVGTLTV